jgi:hypothetical protein
MNPRPKMMIRARSLSILLLLACGTGMAAPPDRVNYQGVLRDANDVPRDGQFNMIFRFFDAATGGNEILVDSHLQANNQEVVVSGGLFSVALGSGDVDDGVAVFANDPYESLTCPTTITPPHGRQLHLPIPDGRDPVVGTVQPPERGEVARADDGRPGEEADGGDEQAWGGGAGGDAVGHGSQDGSQVPEIRQVAVGGARGSVVADAA